jgi:hypothetical protein
MAEEDRLTGPLVFRAYASHVSLSATACSVGLAVEQFSDN